MLRVVGRSALKQLGGTAARASAVPREAACLQQKRGMAGGEDEDPSMFVNWWDNPMNPDAWHKHQLAWFGAAFWVVVFGVAFGGGKKKDAAAPAAAAAATAKA